jgi:hypothetical protein
MMMHSSHAVRESLSRCHATPDPVDPKPIAPDSHPLAVTRILIDRAIRMGIRSKLYYVY